MDLELFNAVRSYLLKKLKKSQLTPLIGWKRRLNVGSF